MRRAVLIGLACISFFGAGIATSATAKPALQIRSLSPFSVRGMHFVPRERVTVTLGIRVLRVRASESGTFVATFRSAMVDPCDGFVVKAVGSKGSIVIFRSRPRMCASTNPG
jgi:hypothetical protein